MNPIDIALRIATSAHAGQLDRDGYPVILHPLTVGLMGHTDEEKMAGFHLQQVSYESLCKLFFGIHDPAQTDGVGPDLGPQYRSCIFYRNESQKQTAEHVTELLRSKGDEVNTLLLPEETFYIGEAYHQHYYEKTGGEPYCHLKTKKF